MILLLWLAEVGLAGWLYGVRDAGGYGVLLGVALVTGLVLSYRETVMRWVVGFGAGVDVMLLASWLAERGTGRDVVVWTYLAGAALAIGSLIAAMRGR